MTTTGRVKNAASKVGKAVEQLQEQVQKLDSPDKIDSLVVRALTYALLLIPLHFFWINRQPYTQLLESWLGVTGAFVSVLGFICVCTVQYFEVRPFMMSSTASAKKRRFTNNIAIAFYVIDLIVCSAAWPVFASEYGLPGLDDIQWVNVGRIIAIVLGLSGWFAFRQLMRRKL
ncbi:hypothetical protein N836_35820 [Leptolyngbya sp. Heron Island J]|uniref:hypothetical protein n=1 Tax=Leptolyngbya sp. Heron Island J TaxID=1385935 RepID=UPI0003B9DDEB|nr:hypothetical protein [Leptolyngbya sp. Heron Island J]ESA37743.1 hypothetical protein N836_35820 [Leptolyngbya sp. Heron Island J]